MKSAHFHCQFDVIKRSNKHSVIKKAAYNTRSNLYQKETQEYINYSSKHDLLDEAILAPKNAKSWVFNREVMYNKVEEQDNRRNSQLGRTIEIGLQHQLTLEQNKELLERYLQKCFVSEGMVVDYAIHASDKDGDRRNIHAHVILSMRKMDGDNFSKKKAREWNDFERVGIWREAWATEVNATFEKLGLDYRTDHRSLKEQGSDRLPQRHEGKQATHLKRRKSVIVSKTGYNQLVSDINNIVEETALLNQHSQLLDVAERKARYLELLEQLAEVRDRAEQLQQEEANYWINRRTLETARAKKEEGIVANLYQSLQQEVLETQKLISQQLKLLTDTADDQKEIKQQSESKLHGIEAEETKAIESGRELSDFEKWVAEAELKIQQSEQELDREKSIDYDDLYDIEPEPPDLELDRTGQSLNIGKATNRMTADNTELEALIEADKVIRKYGSTKNQKPKNVDTEYRLKLAEMTAQFKRENVIKHFREGSDKALNLERVVRDYLRRKGFGEIQIKQAMRRASPGLYGKSKEQARLYAKKLDTYLQQNKRQQQKSDRDRDQQKQRQKDRDRGRRM